MGHNRSGVAGVFEINPPGIGRTAFVAMTLKQGKITNSTPIQGRPLISPDHVAAFDMTGQKIYDLLARYILVQAEDVFNRIESIDRLQWARPRKIEIRFQDDGDSLSVQVSEVTHLTLIL